MSQLEYDGPAWECDPHGNADMAHTLRLTGTFEVTADPGDGFMRVESKGVTYVIVKPKMNAAQDDTFREVNDNWPIADFENKDGIVHFETDDGDSGVIYEDGSWSWD